MCGVTVQAVCILGILLVFAYASVSDIRTRTVSDACWLASGMLAAVCSSALWSEGNAASVPILSAAGSLLLLAYMLSERISGPVAVPVLAAAFAMFAAMWASGCGWYAMVTPAMFSVFLLMYHIGLIRGGADAKAMMVLVVAFPLYPDIGPLPVLWDAPLPMAAVANLPLSVLFVALLLSLAPALFVLARNLSVGDVGRGMLSSYRMPLDDARRSHVWPVEDVADGRVVPCRIPDDPSAVYDRLRESGARDVRITPKIPFVAPVTLAAVLVLVLGSPILAFA